MTCVHLILAQPHSDVEGGDELGFWHTVYCRVRLPLTATQVKVLSSWIMPLYLCSKFSIVVKTKLCYHNITYNVYSNHFLMPFLYICIVID